ncbi:MAG TPA: DUF4383 domain-containing protein [Aromatoleum sp.]|uniref:DUF4383 domain-containing protein n=1 Tax=Aromatoleum sp. TaxID=2307007 RepID=UPI002B458FC8|nr:DUF4383 domain-containing protein [Aromatoleum sp.]HJV24632.1 DUF4383 domain-containing protein [Aromatoleum sp.]
MLRRAALIFGAVFIVAGLLGFVEAVAPHQEPGGEALLFGIFAVNPIHNVVHLLSGIVAIIVGLRSDAASATYFRIFGVIYGVVTLAGIFVGHGQLLGMAHNPADIVLHALVAGAALYLSFGRAPTHPRHTAHHA